MGKSEKLFDRNRCHVHIKTNRKDLTRKHLIDYKNQGLLKGERKKFFKNC